MANHPHKWLACLLPQIDTSNFLIFVEVDSKHFRLLQPFILKGFSDTLHKRSKSIFIHSSTPPTNRTIKQIDKVFNITPTIVTTPQSIYHNLFKNDLLNSAIHFSYLQSFRINILFYYNPSTLTHKEPTGVR
jgi:hypothetical protein